MDSSSSGSSRASSPSPTAPDEETLFDKADSPLLDYVVVYANDDDAVGGDDDDDDKVEEPQPGQR